MAGQSNAPVPPLKGAGKKRQEPDGLQSGLGDHATSGLRNSPDKQRKQVRRWPKGDLSFAYLPSR